MTYPPENLYKSSVKRFLTILKNLK